MAELFASGRIIDLILGLILLETIALVLFCLKSGRGPNTIGIMGNLWAGTSLMLAIRAALMGADWPVVSLWMAAALPGHLVDIALRLRQPRTHPAGR